jgi:hypothetical protein
MSLLHEIQAALLNENSKLEPILLKLRFLAKDTPNNNCYEFAVGLGLTV